MAIQTQKFTPLQHRHYQFAETQGEKDEDLRRRMMLQQQQGNIAMAQQQARLNKDAQTTNANILAAERRAGEQGQRDEFNKGLQLAQLERADEQTAYSRKQDDIERQRQGKSDAMAEQDFKRRGALSDLKMEDARLGIDAKKQAKELTDKTMALGEIGNYLGLMAPNEAGEVDISPLSDKLSVLIPGFKGGKNLVMRNNDGFAELYEIKGGEYSPITTENGMPVRIRNEVLMQSSDISKTQNKEPTKVEQDAFKHAVSAGDKVDDQLRKVQKEIFEIESSASMMGNEIPEASRKRLDDLKRQKVDLATQARNYSSTIAQYQERFNPYKPKAERGAPVQAQEAPQEQGLGYDSLAKGAPQEAQQPALSTARQQEDPKLKESLIAEINQLTQNRFNIPSDYSIDQLQQLLEEVRNPLPPRDKPNTENWASRFLRGKQNQWGSLMDAARK